MKWMLRVGAWVVMTMGASQVAAAMPQSGAGGGVATTQVDRNSGLTIAQVAGRPGSLSVDVHDDQVSIHKELQPGKSTLVLTANHRVVTVRMADGRLVVSGIDGERRLDDMDEAHLTAERSRMAASPVVQAARALLGRLDLATDSVAGTQLTLSKMALSAICGDQIDFRQTGATMAVQMAKPRPAPRPLTVMLGGQDLSGPFKCWDEYSGFVMQIWQDFWQCIMDHIDSWIPEFWSALCEFKWLLQAELSGSWLIACMGGLPVR